MNDLRRLRCFAVLAEELHFGRAAARLHISQPPLTRHIQSLEAELGVQLLNRSARGVELTPAGAVYLEEVRRVLAAAERAAEAARRAGQGMPARCRLLHTGSIMYCQAMGELIRRIGTTPWAWKFQEQPTRQQYETLMRGLADVGVNAPYEIDPPPGVHSRLLFRETLAVCVRAEREHDPVAPLEWLGRAPLILYAPELRAGLHNRVLGLMRAAGLTPGETIEVTQIGTVPALVAGGLGVSVLPSSMARMCWPGVRFLPLGEQASFDVHVAWTDAARPEIVATMFSGHSGAESQPAAAV